MITITRFDTPFRSFGSSGFGSSHEEQLASAARTLVKAESGLSHSEFVSEVAPVDAQRLFEWSDVLKDNRAWLQRVLNPGLDASAEELTKTTRAVFEVLARHGVSAINLRGFGHSVNGMHLAMVLRATADDLEGDPSWQRALEYAQTALREVGIEPTEALYGLMKAE